MVSLICVSFATKLAISGGVNYFTQISSLGKNSYHRVFAFFLRDENFVISLTRCLCFFALLYMNIMDIVRLSMNTIYNKAKKQRHRVNEITKFYSLKKSFSNYLLT